LAFLLDLLPFEKAWHALKRLKLENVTYFKLWINLSKDKSVAILPQAKATANTI